MNAESLYAISRVLVFGSLWGMMFSLIPCCTFGMFMDTAVPLEWGNQLGPNVWIILWLLMQLLFGVLMLRAYLHPVRCGAIGAVLYIPTQLPAAAAAWEFVTEARSRSWSIDDVFYVVPVVLHFGLVCATAVAYMTQPRGPRRNTDPENADIEPTPSEGN